MLLSYTGGALVQGLFIPAFSVAILLSRRDGNDSGLAVRTAVWALVEALATTAAYYVQYIPELAPGWLGDTRFFLPLRELIELPVTPLAALGTAACRTHRFYGPLFFGLLMFFGLPLVRRKLSHRLVFPLAFGTLAAFLSLNVLRSGLGKTHIFQFTKDELVLLPLTAIVYGLLVETRALRGRWRKALASALLAGWVVGGRGARS
jgi:hypothetical protein